MRSEGMVYMKGNESINGGGIELNYGERVKGRR